MRRLGITRHGVTGRLGPNRHLIGSIAAIGKERGVPPSSGASVLPDPIIIGSDGAKLEVFVNVEPLEI
ncbi:MAG: hypothetical protein ACOH2J_00530 [Allorhizobium sp.]